MSSASGIALLKSKLSRLTIMLSSQRHAYLTEIKHDESLVVFMEASCRSIGSTAASLASKLGKAAGSRSDSDGQKRSEKRGQPTPYSRKGRIREREISRKMGSEGHSERKTQQKSTSLKLRKWESQQTDIKTGPNNRNIPSKVEDILSRNHKLKGSYLKTPSIQFNSTMPGKAQTTKGDNSRKTIDFMRNRDWTPKASTQRSDLIDPGKCFKSRTQAVSKQQSLHEKIDSTIAVTMRIPAADFKRNCAKREMRSEDFESQAASRRGSVKPSKESPFKNVRQSRFKEDTASLNEVSTPRTLAPGKESKKESPRFKGHSLDKAIVPSPISTVKNADQSDFIRPELAYSEVCDANLATDFMTDSNFGDEIPIDSQRVKRSIIGNISSPYEKRDSPAKMPPKQSGYNLSFKDLVSVQKLEKKPAVADPSKTRTMADLFKHREASQLDSNPFGKEFVSGKTDPATDPRDTPNWMNLESFKNRSESSEYPSVAGFEPKVPGLVTDVHEFQPSFTKKDLKAARMHRKKRGLGKSQFESRKDPDSSSRNLSRKSEVGHTSKIGSVALKNSICKDGTNASNYKVDTTAESILRNLAKTTGIGLK